jgi:membrane-bound lytic murein transglycosylase A
MAVSMKTLESFTVLILIASVSALTQPSSAQEAAPAESIKNYSVKRVTDGDLPNIPPDGSIEDFKLAISRQLANCARKNPNEKMNFGKDTFTRKQICDDTLNRFLEIANEQKDFSGILAAAKKEMLWFKSTGAPDTGEVKFTGYYFPQLDASEKKEGAYQFPLYRKPIEVIPIIENGKTVWRKKNPDGSFVPYFTRKEIDSDLVLAGRGLEIAWVKDLFDLFIFHVQGAGAIKVKQADGTEKRTILNYAGTNGRAYVSPRRILMDKGVSEEFLTIPGMKKYFLLKPEELVPTLNDSPGYVFFSEADEGPYGVEKIVLTPGHSVAIDAAVLPLGALSFIQTERPKAIHSPELTPFTRFALTQDVGGAIKTPGRVDFYWGDDPYAEYSAGVMNQTGEIYFAVKKP